MLSGYWLSLFLWLCFFIISLQSKVTEIQIHKDQWKHKADDRFSLYMASHSYRIVSPPKNAILFIGDGMSIATQTAGRYMKAHLKRLLGGDDLLVWDTWPTSSLIRTVNSDKLTTDSGSSATAYLGGAKGSDGTLGVTGKVKCCKCTKMNENEKVKSILIMALKAGLSTGIVTTTRVTHATPAAAYAHVNFRDWEGNVENNNNNLCQDIAAQLIKNGIDFNVVMGGGYREFYQTDLKNRFGKPGKRRDGKDLLAEWAQKQASKKRSYAMIFNKTSFNQMSWETTDYVLGLFNHDHLAYAIDNASQPSLSEMTQAAIKILSRNPKGYLLLVEGGRIDHGHHINKAKYALTELLELDIAVENAAKAINPSETLLMVTADHSHTYGLVGYASRNTSVLGFDDYQKGDDGFPYLISTYFNGPGAVIGPRRDPTNDSIYFKNYTQQSLVHLFYSTHSAEDVSIHAIGPYHDLFQTSSDNTFIAYATMFSLCLGGYNGMPHCKINTGAGNQIFANQPLMTILILLIFIIYNNFY